MGAHADQHLWLWEGEPELETRLYDRDHKYIAISTGQVTTTIFFRESDVEIAKEFFDRHLEVVQACLRWCHEVMTKQQDAETEIELPQDTTVPSVESS